jgi:hypothetical protein
MGQVLMVAKLVMQKFLILAMLPHAATSLEAAVLSGITRPDFEVVPRSPFSSVSALAAGAGLSAPPVPFSITINYAGDSAFQQAFLDGAAYWENIIPFYINGNQGAAKFTGITISANVSYIDGPGTILGSAGPQTGGFDDSGYLLAETGSMTFDSSDFVSPNETFATVVLHEMAHVIGIGTLWGFNGLYSSSAASTTDPNNGQTVGRYTGQYGLLGWQAEFDPDATYVPVEKGGAAGTANGHWNEGDGGLSTGYISSITGLDAQYELMTGWLNPGSFLGEVTKGSLRDLGYEVNVIPETGISISVLLSGCGLMFRRRRAGSVRR